MTRGGRLAFFSTCAAAIGAAVIAGASAPAQERSAAPALEITGTTLRVRLADGSTREGASLIGAVLRVVAGGQSLRVRIASVAPDARDPNGEVLLYDFRVVLPSGAEEPLCLADPNGQRLALPLAGRSDEAGILVEIGSGAFELFCTASPQGKCVRLGYAPWRHAPDGRSMRDWFDACVRMMRGDYCGDGHHFTHNGTWIDISDRIGVQHSDEDPTLSFEAAWGPSGAICVARTRVLELITLDALARECPRLHGHLGPNVCTENAADGLIINRSRPAERSAQ